MSIFISVASYCDPELLSTICDAYDKAKCPQDLHFGILDQSVDDLYDNLPQWRDQISYVWMKARDARGVGFARSVIQGMLAGEDYLLQVDSHMRFEQGWDEILIDQMQRLPWKSILTASPMPWDPTSGPQQLPEKKTIKLVPHKEYPLRNTAHIVPWDPEYGFVQGDRLAAGFLFSRGCLYDHLPYDPHIYFNGEEYTYAQRALAAGWNIYHPMRIPVYHLYKQANSNSNQVHWSRSTERYWDPSTLRIKGEKRIKAVMNGASGVYSVPLPDFMNRNSSSSAIRSAGLGFVHEGVMPQSSPLSSLFHDLLSVLYGIYSPLPSGRHSTIVQRVDFGQSSYVLKVSCSDSRKERSVSPCLLPSSIAWNGSGYSCPSILVDVLAPHGHYLLQEYLDIIDLKKRSYRETLEEDVILRGIGEFNARNREPGFSLRIPHKSFALSLTDKGLKRRFPEASNDVLAQCLLRAQQVIQVVHAQIAAHDGSLYSISHNDLHRGNMSIGRSGRSLNNAVFIDFSRLCWAPIGTDLQFIIYYSLRSRIDKEKLLVILRHYIAGFSVGDTSFQLNEYIVLKGAMWAYIHKWLNIHRRPLSPRDWMIFNLCLDVAELFLSVDVDEFLARLPSALSGAEIDQ